MIDPSIIGPLQLRWNDLGARDETLKNPFPPAAVALELIKVALQASTEREEGRFYSFRLSYFAAHDPGENTRPGESYFLPFQKSVNFSPRSLAKLAAAHDPRTTSLSVSTQLDTSGALCVDGIVLNNRYGNRRLDLLPYHNSGPDTLTIQAIAPGNVVVSRRGMTLARLDLSQITYPAPDFTVSYIGEHIFSVVEGHHQYAQFGIEYWYYYRDFLELLLLEALDNTHGATIVWVPSKLLPLRNGSIDLRFSPKVPVEYLQSIEWVCRASQSLDYIERAVIKNKTEKAKTPLPEGADDFLHGISLKEDELRAKRMAAIHADSLSRLAAVDGALVLSDRFELVGFGAFLRAQEQSLPAISHSDPNDTVPPRELELANYGTRHNSAARFVTTNDEAVAFVVSQDKTISGICRRGEELYWYPDCVGSMWS